MLSRASGFVSTCMNHAALSTSRDIGPAALPMYGGSIGIRPRLGLRVKMPHQPAGRRSEPPMSVPICSGPYPAATAAAAPALEPPGVFVKSQGLRDSGWKLDNPDDNMP